MKSFVNKLGGLVLIVLAALVLFQSCSKDTLVTEATEDVSLQNAFPPTEVKNGILFFKNVEDARKAYDLIDDALSKGSDETKVFQELAGQFSHKPLLFSKQSQSASFRNGEDDEFTKDEILLYLASDFIYDDIRKFLLNENYEVGIGSDVYVYFDKNLEFRVLNGDSETLDKFRQKQKGTGVFPIDALNEKVVVDDPDIHAKSIPIRGGDDDDDEDDDHDDDADERDDFRVNYVIREVDCSPTEREFIADLEDKVTNDNGTPNNPNDDFDEWVPYTGSWELDLGDGSAPVLFPNTSSVTFTYDYEAAGTFETELVVVFLDENELNTSEIIPETVEVSDGVCTDEDASVSNWQDNSVKALSTKIWFKNDFFGSHAGAFSHGWWWKANRAKWKRDGDTEIFVEITATFRDNDCEIRHEDHEEDDCNSCSKKRAAVTRLFSRRSISNSEIFSSHSATFDEGTTFTDDLALDPC